MPNAPATGGPSARQACAKCGRAFGRVVNHSHHFFCLTREAIAEKTEEVARELRDLLQQEQAAQAAAAAAAAALKNPSLRRVVEKVPRRLSERNWRGFSDESEDDQSFYTPATSSLRAPG